MWRILAGGWTIGLGCPWVFVEIVSFQSTATLSNVEQLWQRVEAGCVV